MLARGGVGQIKDTILLALNPALRYVLVGYPGKQLCLPLWIIFIMVGLRDGELDVQKEIVL